MVSKASKIFFFFLAKTQIFLLQVPSNTRHIKPRVPKKENNPVLTSRHLIQTQLYVQTGSCTSVSENEGTIYALLEQNTYIPDLYPWKWLVRL